MNTKQKIDEYFESCQSFVDGKKVFINPPTISGLALALGTDRTSLLAIEINDTDYHDKRHAISLCEAYAEEYLFTGKNVAGALVSLKNNFNWSDKIQNDINVKTTHTIKLDATNPVVLEKIKDIQDLLELSA